MTAWETIGVTSINYLLLNHLRQDPVFACSIEFEDAEHYMIRCKTYENQRIVLFNSLYIPIPIILTLKKPLVRYSKLYDIPCSPAIRSTDGLILKVKKNLQYILFFLSHFSPPSFLFSFSLFYFFHSVFISDTVQLRSRPLYNYELFCFRMWWEGRFWFCYNLWPDSISM